MRIDGTTASFMAAAHPRFLSPSPQQVMSPLDQVIPKSCGIRYFLERGQAFGLFEKEIAVSLNIPPEKILKAGASDLRQYDGATIAINMPEGSETKGDIARTLSVYKMKDTDSYYLGGRDGEYFIFNDDALNGVEMGIAVMEWSRHFAGDNDLKQASFLNTFSSKPIPETGYAYRAARDIYTELKGFIHRAFG